jgi:predicted RNA-binding protein with RPS1 domain
MIPPGTATGNWYIIAKADGEEVVTETSETNNTSSKLIQIGPDLDITVLSAPGTAGGGLSIGISDTTKNLGGEPAGPSRTNFFLSADGSLSASDILLGSRDLPPLPAGASSSGSATVMIPQGTAVGNWYIIAKADAEGTVTEVTEFGAFVNFGPIDGLIHVSQITEDFMSYDQKNAAFIGRESNKILKVADVVQARIVTVSMKSRVSDSKIGLTMRQPYLGKLEWIEDDQKRAQEKAAGAPGKEPAEGKEKPKKEKNPKREDGK